MTVTEAIARAEDVLPGQAAQDQASDPRWQAIIRAAEFVESDPEPLWNFARKWGSSNDEDLRAAVATCLLEHLLEHHFTLLFPRVVNAAREDSLFADTFLRCWKFGQAEFPANAAQFDALSAELSNAGILRPRATPTTVYCEQCRSEVSIPTVDATLRSRVAQLRQSDQPADAYECLSAGSSLDLRSAKRLVAHLPHRPGRCHRCDARLPGGTVVTCDSCHSLNIQWDAA
jgi:hypothetical protein